MNEIRTDTIPPCPYCDRHDDPTRRVWGVWTLPINEGDDKPRTIHVGRADGSHIAESDAQWIRDQLNTRPNATPMTTNVVSSSGVK